MTPLPNQAPGGARRGLAALLLLVGVPIWYSPLTRELGPQKDLLLALGLVCAAPWASPLAALALTAGAVVGLLWMGGAHEVLPLAVAPLLVRLFRALWKDGGAAYLAAGLAGVALLAGLQGLGAPLFPGTEAAFSLPYRVLTGPLGNPNALAGFLLLGGLAYLAARPPRALTLRPQLALGGLALLILATRSHAGWLGLGLALLAGGVARFGPRALVALLPLAGLAAWRWESLSYALAGRWYLTQVHANLGAEALLRGLGPGAQAGAFLHWQAAFLQAHPAQAERWSFPEHAHNDLLSLVVTWGLPLVVLGIVWTARVTRWRALPKGLREAAWLALAVTSLGGTVLYISPLWVAACALWAALTEEPPSPPARWASWLAGAAALVWLALCGGRAAADLLARAATEQAISQQPAAALATLDRAAPLPQGGLRLGILRARILLSADRCPDALPLLVHEVRAFPHPQVFQMLAACYQATGQADKLSSTLTQWKFFSPSF